MLEELDGLMSGFQKALSEVKTKPELGNLKSDFVGKKGKVSSILKSLKDATPEERKTIGAKSNLMKEEILKAIEEMDKNLDIEEINQKLAKNWQDITLNDIIKENGLNAAGYHPVTLIQREIEDIFISMGFDILDGPHIEDEFHNFEALNIPKNHPARDMQDTFWFKDMEHLLRTHTSPIQVRGMESKKPPFKFVGPGKVFRCEKMDASHEMVFHQLEGMMVGENISTANLIFFMKKLLSEIFKRETNVRLRPGFFPFVEPGFELDIECVICKGKGCSVCKQVGWVELLPCGMVHPNVLKAGGIDTDKYNGFAFGLGLDRLVMMKYMIDDVRHIHSGDLRFSQQFKEY
ncbi:MAG: phenylalanine--tRNA ligase subunit alpha [Spirochaetaceae bacterium]